MEKESKYILDWDIILVVIVITFIFVDTDWDVVLGSNEYGVFGKLVYSFTFVERVGGVVFIEKSIFSELFEIPCEDVFWSVFCEFLDDSLLIP